MSASNEIATFAGEKWLSQTKKKQKELLAKMLRKEYFPLLLGSWKQCKSFKMWQG